MAINKVVVGDEVKLDLTADTVVADKLAKGITAHNMSGEQIIGTMEQGSGAEPDNSTIILNDDGKLETTIGGKWVEGKKYKLYKDIKFSPTVNPNTDFGTQLTKETVEYMYNNGDVLCSIGTMNQFLKNKTTITMTESEGVKTYTITFEAGVYTMTGIDNGSTWEITYINNKGGYYGLKFMTIYTNEPAVVASPIKGQFVPVDNKTISVDENGNITSQVVNAIGHNNWCFGEVASLETKESNNVVFNKGTITDSGDYNFVINKGTLTANSTLANLVGGYSSCSLGQYNIIHGEGNSLIGAQSSIISGYNSSISGSVYGRGNFVCGIGISATSTQGLSQHAVGKYNITNTDGTYFYIVGNGNSASDRSNAYTLDWEGNGTFSGTVSSSTGADYAEYFEWKDGNPDNEDRVGYIVTLDGNKIVKANTGDDVLGICSGTAMVLGDSAEWNWNKRYVTDDFGRIVYEDREVQHEAIYNPNGELIEEAYTETVHAPKLNPSYDASKPYTKRADRPEWQIVGMMGKLYVRDDGTCVVNGYADVKDGIATKANSKTNMRVMERVTDNIVRVLMK